MVHSGNPGAKTYKTIDLARIAGVHPNTVRFYEAIGILSPVPRAHNGYRMYSDRHVAQIRVCRCIYDHGWIGRSIRKASNAVMDALQVWDIVLAKQKAEVYRDLIESELAFAQDTAVVLERWVNRHPKPCEPMALGYRQVAQRLGVSAEVLRNWERNGLIQVPRIGPNRERVYGAYEVERLRIIHMLRQAQYSMSAIHASLSQYDRGDSEGVVSALNHPEIDEDATWIWVGDRWLEALNGALNGARQIADILAQVDF